MTIPALALRFEEDRTVFLDGARVAFSMPLTPRALAERHWPRGMPGPLQLERAIDDVEVAIEQLKLAHADRGALCVSDTVLHRMHEQLGHDVTRLGRDDVESLFTGLVARSAAGGQGGADGESAAALLMLREVMHHLGFAALRSRCRAPRGRALPPVFL